ncbi:NAD-dependent deacylase [candidate division WOR-3 bacterium]|nr:NAD-dependent deacylase [candidate division WOR-3 bacterium]
MEDKIKKARDAIAKAYKIIVFTGAGISKESGVPTFREAGGLWEEFKAEDFATPEAFSRRPKEVWEWYRFRRDLARKVEPNPGHYAVARLEDARSDFMVATQNIDNLHTRAGSRNVIELHGNIMHSYCMKCGLLADESEAELPGEVPVCPREGCGGVMRPKVVWFGEQLDPDDLDRSYMFASEADCCLVIGTSGFVYPAAQIPFLAKRNDACVIEINPEPSGITQIADYFLQGPAAQITPQLLEENKYADGAD